MKNTIFWLCLLCTIHLSAQDRILTLKQDTLKAKVNSIDKQKIVYYLEADADKKLQELPVADLHKIIWRTGLEYIINQEFEDKQKKIFPNRPATTPVSTTKSVEQKPTIIEQKKEVVVDKPPVEAPEITMDNNVAWVTFRVDGKKATRHEIERILRAHDYNSYHVFKKGSNLFSKGRIIVGGAVIIFAYWLASYSSNPSDILQYLSSSVGIVGSYSMWHSVRLMEEAVKGYQFKRINNNLKPAYKSDIFIP